MALTLGACTGGEVKSSDDGAAFAGDGRSMCVPAS